MQELQTFRKVQFLAHPECLLNSEISVFAAFVNYRTVVARRLLYFLFVYSPIYCFGRMLYTLSHVDCSHA